MGITVHQSATQRSGTGRMWHEDVVRGTRSLQGLEDSGLPRRVSTARVAASGRLCCNYGPSIRIIKELPTQNQGLIAQL